MVAWQPVDIIGDAGPDRYRGAAMQAVLQDANTDAVLVMNCPTALASSVDAAKATVEAVENGGCGGDKKPVLETRLSRSKVEKVTTSSPKPTSRTSRRRRKRSRASCNWRAMRVPRPN